MNSREWDRDYGSYAEFYDDAYGRHLASMHEVGSSSAVLIESHQSAGDWSDAPTPDLIIAWLPSSPVGFSYDLGAGRFRGRMRTGDAILIAPGAGSTILVDGAHVCRGLAIPYRTLYRMTGVEASPLPSDGDFGPLHGRLLRNTTLRSLLDELCREASSSRPHGALLADGITVQIAATLLRMRDGAGEPVPSGLAPWQLRRATDLLMSRLAGDVALTDVADELGLSAAHLSRAFKQSTGLPPWRWLAERRIERAKALLADPSLSLTDVAQMVGYAGQTTFGEAFRRATGMTPGAFRREIRR